MSATKYIDLAFEKNLTSRALQIKANMQQISNDCPRLVAYNHSSGQQGDYRTKEDNINKPYRQDKLDMEDTLSLVLHLKPKDKKKIKEGFVNPAIS